MRSGVLSDEMIKRMVAGYLQSGLDATERMRLQDFGNSDQPHSQDFFDESSNKQSHMTSTSDGVDAVSNAFAIAVDAPQKDLATAKIQGVPWIQDAADLLIRNAGIHS